MEKKLISTLIVILVAVVVVCWFFEKTKNGNSTPTVSTNEVTIVTTMTNVPSNPPYQIVVENTNKPIFTNEITSRLVLSNYETLDDLKKIKTFQNVGNYLKYLDWYSNSNLVDFQLQSVNGKPVAFTADMMWALTDKKDGHVRQLTLHSPEMDIDQIRQIGLELDEAWGLDPSDFLAWCSKVGNKWLDAPLFSSRNGIPPAPNQYIGFSVRSGLNDEKPWYIGITIQDK
jgi:hypothetical protein